MKTAAAIWILVLGSSLGLAADRRLIPFDDFYLRVSTNWRADRGGEGAALDVGLKILRHPEEPEGRTEIEVSCLQFAADARKFSEQDLKVFFQACEAAAKGEDFEKEILSPTFFGRTTTRFESASSGKRRIVKVSRGQVETYFSLAEAENAREALAFAEAGKAWYGKLLAETELPAITPAAHPPPGKNLYFASTVGKVPGGGFAIEVGLSRWKFGGEEYQIRHALAFDGQWIGGGPWTEALLASLNEAVGAGKEGQSFARRLDSPGADEIFVTVHPDTGRAEVMMKPGDPKLEGITVENPLVFGSFGERELWTLLELESLAEEQRKWFQEHESWFIVPPPKEP